MKTLFDKDLFSLILHKLMWSDIEQISSIIEQHGPMFFCEKLNDEICAEAK